MWFFIDFEDQNHYSHYSDDFTKPTKARLVAFDAEIYHIYGNTVLVWQSIVGSAESSE